MAGVQNNPRPKENWVRVYTLVIAFLVLQIVVYTLLSWHYT